jgi:hypothetical protein
MKKVLYGWHQKIDCRVVGDDPAVDEVSLGPEEGRGSSGGTGSLPDELSKCYKTVVKSSLKADLHYCDKLVHFEAQKIFSLLKKP